MFRKFKPSLFSQLAHNGLRAVGGRKPFSSIDHSATTFNHVEDNITGVHFVLSDRPGILMNVLGIFTRFDVNLTRIQSKPSKHASAREFEFFVDFEGDPEDTKTQKVLEELKIIAKHMDLTQSLEVPWFPRHRSDLSEIGKNVLSANDDLPSDHPGFQDLEYRQRRDTIASIAQSYTMDSEVPYVDYNEKELACWNTIYSTLTEKYQEFACEEYLEILPRMEKECGFSARKIPQLRDISAFLKENTGWIFKPTAGLLTQREFLNGLAFRVFHSTQYLRHHSVPFYTPEPDIVHELMGHAPMFANPEFADFSQEIGLASLGATDRDIERLGTLYWFTVEFGLVNNNGKRKAYGAGVLSSVDEMNHSMSDVPEIVPLDCDKVADMKFPITTVQPVYTLANSFQEAKDEIINFSNNLPRPFSVTYDDQTGYVIVDRKIKIVKSEELPDSELLF